MLEKSREIGSSLFSLGRGHSETALEEFGELELIVEAVAFGYVPERAVGREGEGVVGHIEL